MAERPLYTLYKNLKAQNYDVPDDYNKFESALTRDGKGGADNRHAIYENLKAQNFDVPNTYERFYSALFEPRSKTSSRAKGGSVPMSAADRARFSAGAVAISASAQHTMNNAGRYNRLKQRKQKQQKDFGRVNLGTHQTPYGGDANNVVKDDFAYNPETGKAGAYVSSDNENVYSQPEAEQKQDVLDQQNNAYQEAVDTGEIPSVFDVRDKNGNYDLQENINKNGTYLTEEGARNQFDKKLADAYARKKEIEALIAEDHRQHGNPLLSYGASIGASNGRTAEQSDYSNKLATSLAMVKQQIGALEAVKQYPTSSWSEDALKALDNTAFTAKTWDFGLTDFATMGQMERIKTKMDNNLPLSGSDKMLLKSKLGADAAAALEDEKMGNIYRWTKIAGQSLPFMADFFLTGGYGGITKAISRGALKFAAKRGMGKVSAAILKNTGIVAGDVIGSYAMAGSEQAMKTGADIMQRHLGSLYQDEKGDYKFGTFDENGNLLHEGGESMGTALYKGLTSAMVENYTEKLFGHSYGIKKGAINFMEKHGMNASAEFFKNIGKSGWYTNSKKWMEKFGINGFGEEVMEEEIGIPLHALLDGDNKFSDLLDTKQQLDIIGGMALSVGSMYAMGAGSRPVKGVYNRAQYYRFRNKVNVADSDAQNLMGDKWADIKDKIDNTTNEQMGGVLADILRQRDTMSKEQINAAINYGINLMKMRGYNVAKTAEMNAREITNEPTTPEEQHQADIDNAYSEGHDADDADKHDIQLEHEDQMKTLAGLLNISEQQLSAMNDDELQSLTGQNDKLDQAIYDYQLSSARYQGVTDDAQDKIDMAANQAAQRVDMYTDKSRGSVRNATVKASGGAEDYGVYIISGNIATNEDGSINVADSDDMILFYDPTTNSVEHADALRFAELGDEVPADDVKAQAVADAKEKAIKEVAGIVDGTIDVGSQFKVTGADGLEHTYEILADYGDGTAAISIDGNVVENPYSLADLQQMKDMEDQKRLETAKAQREQIEKERAAQQTQQTQPSFDFNQILNDNGNVVLADVLGKDGNTKYPNSQLFLIRDSGAKAKVVELKSDGTLVPHAVNKKDVRTATTMTLDEYKQAFAESSMIEENSGAIEVEDNEEGKLLNRNDDGAQTEQNQPSASVTTSQEDAAGSSESKDTNISANGNKNNESLTFEDGTPIPVDVNGEVDLSQTDATHAAEWYDNNLGEDADDWLDGEIKKAKKVLEQAKNKKLAGTKPSELVASKKEKEAAIADAQAHYDSAISIRDSLKERRIAKEENTAEGRRNLIEKARRKFARLKSAVKDDAEAVSQLYRDTIGSLLHRLYDSTGIDVTDTIPLTAEEYVASNLGAHSLNYEGTETSKGVKQETGLSREDFAKTQLLAADGKGTTIDNLVHSLWENRPSNLESLDTQDIRNALIGVLNSGFKVSEARNFVENIRIAQAENILEEQKRAQENAAYAEQHKAESEAELKAKSDEKAESKAKSEAKLDNESDNKSNDLSNETDNEKINDNINDNINTPEQTKFPDNLKEGSKTIEVPEDATDEKPLGEQRTKSPFLVRENGKQQTETESDADVEKNKVDDIKVVDNIVRKKTRKTLEKIAMIMGANIQWLYSNKQFNGKFDEKTNTIYLTLDSSITEGVQFIFGHEMTHEMRTKNPAAYDELKTLVKDMMGEDIFSTETDKMQERYKKGGARYWNDRDAIEEEVVADQLGSWIRDANYAHTLLLKMSHPLLARLHEIVNRFLMALHGTEFSEDMRLILRSIEQAYVKTAKGEVTNSETGEDVSFSLRQKPEPKKKGIGYKVFVLKDGKLYPPMVANPDGAETPVGVWLDADAAPIAGESKTGRPQVKQGGNGTQGGSGKLAYRPGWHLGVVPYAIQFNRKDADGNKTLFPKNFVFAEVEYAADVDYQEEARQEGINPSGKYQHSLAGLKHLPTDGYYMYRTNPNPETDPWVITGAMKVNRILTRAEQAELVKNAGREPQQIQEGDIVTDDVVNSINQEIADAPKFSLKVYHGTGADFTEFDFDHMGEGAGSQVFGWGGYVTSSKKIGKSYATLMDNDPSKAYYRIQRSNGTRFAKKYPTLESFLHGDKQIAMNDKFTEQEKIDYYNEMKKLAEPYHNLYEVDIPDDNGSNYMDWDKPLSKNQQDAIREGLEHLGVGIKMLESKGQSLERNGENIYNSTLYIGLIGTEYDLPERTKGISKFLSSVGFTGVKYKAGRNFGGAKKGDTNYVIFKPEDMKITEHTKFSIKTYHGSQASFDQFDHSFMGSGEGAQAYGWGTYVSEVEGIAKAYAKANAKKNAPSRLMYQGKPMTYKTPSIIYQVALDMDKFNISAKEVISKMIDADEKKLASVADTQFAKMKAKQVQDELKVLKDLNPSDFKINEDYDTVAQDLVDTKSGLDLLEDELKDAKSYVDLYQSRLDEAKEELSKAKESGTGLGVDMYESDVAYYSEQVEKYKQNVKTKESDIKDVKTKVDALQKKLDSMEKPRNLYSVEIPDDTGDNYLGWDEPLNDRQIDMWKNAAVSIYPNLKEDVIKFADKFIDKKKGNVSGQDAYDYLTNDVSPKEASMALKDAGFDGVKVIAQRNTGGNKEGRMNYVIFDENNAQITSHTKFSLKDNQGNPLNQDGTLKLDKIKSVDELTDEDFLHPTRNVELPSLPKKIADAIGTEGKPVVIKKNIFERNYMRHKDVTPELSKVIFKSALYNPDLYGQNQKKTRPYNWVLINTKDEKGNNRTVLLEVNPNKDNVEIVHWHFIDERGLKKIKKQADREDGQLLILPSNKEEVGALSDPTVNLSAAKINNSSETAKKNSEKFSLKDEKTMFGMHNISIDKLRKAIKQGGFAAPSMGVVDSNNGIYSDYGEITLIPKAEKLAKRTGKNAGTFTADAWTPTYPQVERIMNKQGEKAFNTDMNEKLGDVDNGIYSNIRESWKGYFSSGDVRDGLYWHYLFDKGMNPETIYQTGKYDNDITNEVMRISDNGSKTDYTDEEVAELIQLKNKATGEDNDVEAMREKLKARIASAEKKGNHLLAALKKKRLAELEGVENFYIAADFVNDVVRNNRKNGKVDVHDTMSVAKEKVENDKKLSVDFPSWLDKKTEEYGVEEMLYNGTTPSGKPKYIPNTIDNAVKLMKKQGVAGGYTAFGSELGVFIAKNSPEVNTLAAMKNAKDKLIPFGDERHNQIKNKITKEFLELSDEIRVGLNNRYAFDDSGVSRMVELTDHKGNEKEYLKKAYNVEVSDEWMDRYNKLLDTIKKDYKVFYFETKFMRPYGLDEFEKAIVPSDTPSDVVDALKKAGIDVSSYERGNAEDRQKVTMDAINSSDNIRFSLRDMADGKESGAADMAEDLKSLNTPDDNGSNYLDWEGTIPDSLDKQKVAEDAYKVVSDNQGFNDFKATPLNDFIAHTLKTYVNTTDVAGRVEKLKSDIKDVIDNYVADDDVLALNEYLKDATPDDVLATIWYNDLVRDIKDADLGEELYRKLSTYVGDNAASQILSDNGLVGIKYPAGMIHGGAKEGDYNYVIFDENNANIVGNTRFSLRYDQFEHDLNQWKKDNNLPKDAQRPTIPQRNAGESAVDFLRRVDEYRKQMALWKTAPTYEQHLLSDDTALGEFNRELQRGSVLKRIAFQDSMLAIRKAQEAIMKEVGVDRLNMAEDAYTAENRSHGKGKNEFEEYNNEFLQPLRKAYHQMKKVLGNSYDNVRVYMMAKHGLERDAQMAFKKSLEADYEDVNQRSAAYKAYKNDLDRVSNDADLEFGRVDFTTWRQKDNALRGKYSPSYMDYRYDDNGIAYDYSGLSSLFDGSDFEDAAHRLVRDVETKHLAEVQALWNATNAATKKILRDGFKAGMMSKDTYEYVKGMYSHYIPLRGWDGTTADQVWDYIGGGKGAFNQTLKTAHGRTSIADDPIAYIENMAESGILLNNKNWVKQHLMLLAQNHPTSLLTLSKAWYVKSTDANGNEEWIPATPQITSQMNSNQVKAAIDAFEQKMEQMAQTGDATQQRDGLNIAYPQTHSEEREHEVRVMKDGEEYVIYVNGDPQLAQAMNNTRAHRVREIQSGKLDRATAWLGRKMAAAYTSLSPLFIPSNYFRDLTMTLASTAIREDGRYNYLLRKNLATSWNLGFMLRDYQNGKLREKVSNGNATAKEQMFYDFMMNGGETGFVSSLDVEDLKKKFKNDLKDLDRWKANPVKVGHTIMDGIEFLNRAIEDSNRFAVYMTSIQYGRSIDEAVNDAKDVTLNFNRKGTGEYGWQMIRNLYLFINPAVQSLQTLGALAKHHPFKFTAVTAAWLASGVLVPIVNAALMSLLGGDDDKDKYWQFSKWDRRNNAIMWIPFTNEYVKIPLAQEFRAFYGIGDMIASKMMGGELAEETWSQYAEDLLGQVVDMLPLDPTGYDGNIAVSLMPNPIRPVFELAFNVDFTGKPLFKDTEYNKYDPNFTKAYVGTPDWLVRVSKMVNSIGNDYPDVQQNAIDAFGDPRYNLNNPAVVDHVLSSYLGGAYTMGSQVLGVLTKSLNDPKEIKMADIPLVSKFVSNPDDRPVTKKQGDEFWNMKENHDRAANTLSKLKKQAKVDGDYSILERFYGSEEYKQYKQEDVKVKKYEEDKKKERAEESGEEYRPHKLNAEDIYKAHATPKDDFEDLKLKQLYTKLNGFKTSYDLLVDTAPGQSDGYYNTNKAAIDAIDEISLDKQEISELKKGFLEDGKDAYNAEDMKRIRELRKRILSVLEPANKVVVANQKEKAEKK